VLQAWYPGQECGNAIADVLLGTAEPGGRLPQTWPMQLQDTVGFGNALHYPGVDGHVVYAEGVFIGYRHYQQKNIVPLFPFGHGLSYTQFSYGALRLASTELQPGGELLVEMDVQNVGQRAGQTVVQLYVTDTTASQPRPAQELKGFAKLTLAVGATGTVRFRLGMRAFAFFDVARAAWVAEAGGYQVHAGTSVDARLASASLTLSGDWVQAV
jgi:beta-glucosidase